MKIACCGLLCSVFLKAKMFRHKLWYPNPLKAPKNQPFLCCQSCHTSVWLRLYALKSQDFSCVLGSKNFLNENYNAVQGKSAANTGVFASILTP